MHARPPGPWVLWRVAVATRPAGTLPGADNRSCRHGLPAAGAAAELPRLHLRRVGCALPVTAGCCASRPRHFYPSCCAIHCQHAVSRLASCRWRSRRSQLCGGAARPRLRRTPTQPAPLHAAATELQPSCNRAASQLFCVPYTAPPTTRPCHTRAARAPSCTARGTGGGRSSCCPCTCAAGGAARAGGASTAAWWAGAPRGYRGACLEGGRGGGGSVQVRSMCGNQTGARRHHHWLHS